MSDEAKMIEEKPPCPACLEQRVHTDEEWKNHPYHPEELKSDTRTER